MKFDFTLETYQELLKTLLNTYKFYTFQEFLTSKKEELFSSTNHQSHITDHSLRITPNSIIILRHDVDRLPQNAFQTAKIEYELGIKGTYYFRIVPKSYNLKMMQQISEFGHEIGYHYEDVDLVVKSKELRVKSNEESKTRHSSLVTNHSSPIPRPPSPIPRPIIDTAYESFCRNLEMLRKNFDIKTICMHGSPRSKYDNRIIWEKYDYRELGIIGEPYFDIDFNEFAYFTDTGRRWNGDKVSIRDKVNSKYNFNFKTTCQIIENIDKFPDKILFTIHPQRWHDRPWPWLKELLWQNVKNLVKRYRREK